MDYIQFFTLFGTMLTGFGFMYKEFKSIEKDIREDIRIQSRRSDQIIDRAAQLHQSFQEEMGKQSARSDQLYTAFREELKTQSGRTDQLYTMFIDLLKAKNKETKAK